jgi:hypothetical protein
MRYLRFVPAIAITAMAAGDLFAQSNTTPGLDLRLFDTHTIQRYRRTGTFPTGVQAIGAWTTCCNPGSVRIPFTAAMNPNHGFIHYIVARQSDGRLVQISDRAYVKHTFGSNNDPSTCGSCAGPGDVNFVEVGCADTYANSQAVDHFNLGPPDEIDPWLGTWNPVGSYFDRGDPDVGSPNNHDGVRSLTTTQANTLNLAINHAMRVYDVDLNVPGASFYWQSGYLVPHESDATRGDNIGSHQFNAVWNGSTNWNFTDVGTMLAGTILQRWSGASITSATNGPDDGRFYVAVKVTGPTNGIYHYEYAIHNRDNNRGCGAFHIPVCPEAQVTNFGFHDVDQIATNQWSAAKSGNEILFQTIALQPNPLKWNSIFNFWFNCDAAPLTGNVSLDQYAIGPGALTIAIPSTTPTGTYNVNLGPGCGNPTAPSLFGVGSPDRGTLGNATFGLRCIGNPPNAACGFVLSLADGTTLLAPGCTLYSASTNVAGPVMSFADATGVAAIPLAVPNVAAFEGTHLDFQMVNFATGGALLGGFNLSNGLRVRVGSLISGCP